MSREKRKEALEAKKMKQGLLLCRSSRPPSLHLPFSPSPPSIHFHNPQNHTKLVFATVESVQGEHHLTARERRKLRNERRASSVNNWKEEVEERLLTKPKNKYASWTEELNLDKLAELGPQWWVVRIRRVTTEYLIERLVRALVRNHPDFEFKVYVPSVQVKRKLKNGTISVKPKNLFPGCVFLRCVLNKEMHDFIRECEGVGGFIGSLVGNTKKQINRPKPVSTTDIEAIFRQAKEEQEKADQQFEEQERNEAIIKTEKMSDDPIPDVTNQVATPKQKKRTTKGADVREGISSKGSLEELLIRGSSVRVVSGPFTEFRGKVKKLYRKTGTATVSFILFGKESLVNLDLSEIVAETSSEIG